MSNKLSVIKTSNTNKKNHQHKFAVPLCALLEKNCNKKFKQIIANLVRFQMKLKKKTIFQRK